MDKYKSKPTKRLILHCSFSLVELLVSLIIISLLIGAFAPIITKKLKATDVTVGSFSTNIVQVENRKITPKDCETFGALYIPAHLNDGVNDICATKFNVGDNNIPISDRAITLKVGQTCSDIGNCCWQGITAADCEDKNNADSTYSACNRTVCQWYAANTSCQDYMPKGSFKGNWRLPTVKEITGWIYNINTLNNYKGTQGLQLCNHGSSGNGAFYCTFNANCIGSKNNHCGPNNMWADASSEAGKSNSFYLFYAEGRKEVNSNIQAYSTRCVIDTIVENTQEIDPEPIEPTSQADCDPYNALFIPKEINVSTGKGLCVTKYNIGEGLGPHLDDYNEAGITIAIAGGSACNSEKCCFVGKTAEVCDNTGYGTSTYSGCSRTVCTHAASTEICANWEPKGTKKGFWRLPTYAEATDWSNVIQNETTSYHPILRYAGKDGLQLCNYGDFASISNSIGVANCAGAGSGLCKGLNSNTNCNVHGFLTASYSTGMFYGYDFSGPIDGRNYFWGHAGVDVIGTSTITATGRCVTDKLLK